MMMDEPSVVGVSLPPLPIRCFHHVARECRNLEESLRFYTEVLGFRETARPPFETHGEEEEGKTCWDDLGCRRLVGLSHPPPSPHYFASPTTPRINVTY